MGGWDTGICTIRTGLHVDVDIQHRVKRFACHEHPNALCISANGSSVLFPNKGDVVVPASTSPRVPLGVVSLRNHTCNWRNIGQGRVIVDVDRYDVSACDVYSMTVSFFLFRGEVYVIPMPFPPILHFFMCVVSVSTISAILYVLRPQTHFIKQQTKDSSVVESAGQVPVDLSVLLITVAVVTACCVQAVNRTYVTQEDRVGFALLAVTFLFYLLSAMASRCWLARGEEWGLVFKISQYEKGVTVDMLVCGLLVLCVCMYSTLQHPFKFVTTGLLMFRQWHKLIRFSYGETFVVGYPYSIPYVFLRFLLDSLNVCFSVAYGWNLAFNSIDVAGFFLVPAVCGTYVFAKYIFLIHVHISQRSASGARAT
jgi:hypothetical protein